MQTSMLHEIHRLRQMSVAELQIRWRELNGKEPRSTNRVFLWRRLAYRLQELAHGGLSDRAKSRVEELVPEVLALAKSQREAPRPAREPGPRPVRDLRLPTPGSTLTRPYHGREIRVLVLDDGFEWEGRHYNSLSAVAWAVTGAKWNGRLFFGLTKRKR